MNRAGRERNLVLCPLRPGIGAVPSAMPLPCDRQLRAEEQTSMISPNNPQPEPAEPFSAAEVRHRASRLWSIATIVSSTFLAATAWRPARHRLLGQPSDPLSVSTSYVVLRNGIGVLGFALPIAMIVGGGLDHIQPSLSAYYHFSPERPGQYGAGTMRDLFVGLLCAIGAFLFFYRGHSLLEDVALNVAGISAVLVALFPMDWPPAPGTTASVTSRLHSGSATLFFLMIAYVCVFRARDTLYILEDESRRRMFERLYLTFGLLMLATPAMVALLAATSTVAGMGYETLIVESGGVFVFAAFWLVKSFEIRSAVRRSGRR